jgi:GAF domain-containing protein
MSLEWQFLIALNERLRPLRDPVEIQEVAVRSIGQHLDASRVNYAQIDGDESIVCRSYASVGRPLVVRGAVAHFGKAIVDACRRGETVSVTDVRTDLRFTDAERAQLLAGETAAFVATPLFKDGRWVAAFSVHCASPRAWTRDQIALIEATAERAWAAGERALAAEALEGRESRLAFLLRLNDALRPLGDPARILEETCRLLGKHLDVNRVAYGEIEGDDCVIVSEYVDGLPSQPRRFPWRNLGGSRNAEILKGGTLSVNDTSTGPHTAEERAALLAAGIAAYICPLLIKDGQLVGAFGIHSSSPRVWTPDEIALVQEVADRTWETLERHKAAASLRANEERLAFLLRLNDALRPLSDPTAVQETAASATRFSKAASS